MLPVKYLKMYTYLTGRSSAETVAPPGHDHWVHLRGVGYATIKINRHDEHEIAVASWRGNNIIVVFLFSCINPFKLKYMTISHLII